MAIGVGPIDFALAYRLWLHLSTLAYRLWAWLLFKIAWRFQMARSPNFVLGMVDNR